MLLARRAPAAAGGPPPYRVSDVELQRRALAGWLADHEPLGDVDVAVRQAASPASANSCHAVGDPGMPMAEAAARIVEYAHHEQISPMAQVITGSAEEAHFVDLGWTDTHVPVDVLATRLADFLADRPTPPGVRVAEELEESWLPGLPAVLAGRGRSSILRMILDGNPPRAFGSVGSAAAPMVAIARGHLSGDWLGMARCGPAPASAAAALAAAVMTALGHWGARQRRPVLLCPGGPGNQAAQAAYARLGFVRHHSYLYLAPPSASQLRRI